MGDLLIHNIPDDLQRDLAARAERNGTSLSDEARNLLHQAMADASNAALPKDSAWKSLREIFAPKTEAEFAEAEEFVKIMDEIEQERKREFGRPSEFGA